MVIKFLSFRRHHAKQRPPRESQIRPFIVKITRDQKILLLSSGNVDPRYLIVVDRKGTLDEIEIKVEEEVVESAAEEEVASDPETEAAPEVDAEEE